MISDVNGIYDMSKTEKMNIRMSEVGMKLVSSLAEPGRVTWLSQ